MNRRGFLTAAAGLIAAPAVVKSENLMRIAVPPAPRGYSLGTPDCPVVISQLEPFCVVPQQILDAVNNRVGRYPAYPHPPKGESDWARSLEMAFYQPPPAYWRPGERIPNDFPNCLKETI